MQSGDTIIACATAAGSSRRAVLRVSGPDARRVLSLLGRGGEIEKRRGLTASRIEFADGRGLACIAAVFPGPASYTGEDVVEFLLPGNPHLIERVMAAAMERVPGVRLASPGEFTARAYLNERMTLEQAEGVAALIAARGSDELEEARRLMSGERGAAYGAMSDEVMTLLALVEAGIDFTDQEDVVPITPRMLAARCEGLASRIESVLGGRRGAEVRPGLARAVLVGEPNAGKSTLFNALLGRKRAVVSPVAGTTRDVLEERLDLSRDLAGGGEVLLCDTAGVEAGQEVLGGREEQEIEAGMRMATRRAVEEADVAIWCDPTGRFEGAMPAPSRGKLIRVRTKADLPQDSRKDGNAGGGEVIEVSALDGYHLPTLRRAIGDAAGAGIVKGGVLPRHRRALKVAGRCLEAVAGECQNQEKLVEPELVAGKLREALDALGELTGRMTPDDVIGRVFATFCVGK